jgi:hypothetical protein
MYIIGEYAAVVTGVLIVTTLLFTVCLLYLVLQKGCRVVARKLLELTSGTIPLIGRWMAAEPRKP